MYGSMVIGPIASLGLLLLGQGSAAQSPPSVTGQPLLAPGAVVAKAPDSIPFVLVGVVLDPDGVPAQGAVVVSSAGGRAVSGRNGNYRLECQVPLDARSIQVTAFGQSGTSHLASTRIDLPATSGVVYVDSLRLTQGAACSPRWLPTFEAQPRVEGFLGSGFRVSDLTVFDDGSGRALYAETSNGVARWDGARWSFVGGREFHASCFAAHDDGHGPALYLGTSYGVESWDGSSWKNVGFIPYQTGFVHSMTAFDDGSGPALYAGGRFSGISGVAALNVAKWNGTAWMAVGSGLGQGDVNALEVFDDGTGPALYAGGEFTGSGGSVVTRIAKWNGSSWVSLGLISGPGLLRVAVDALEVFDDGSGPALYAGGRFTGAGSVRVNGIARWDGSSWSALGRGMNQAVSVLRVLDDGSGPALYAGGDFTTAGEVPANHVARWDGSSWSAVGSGMDGGVRALARFDAGSGPALYAGGSFDNAGDTVAEGIAKLEGSRWAPLSQGFNNPVNAITVFDDGRGPAVYVGGGFTAVGGVRARSIARWDGSSWTSLGSGIQFDRAIVHALAVFDDGHGPALYAGGEFMKAGGVPANSIARWDGSSWAPLGSGMANSQRPYAYYAYAIVHALTVFDDGRGPALYAAGTFDSADGVPAENVARWDGSRWTAVGSLGDPEFDTVHALVVHDDGSGPGLYAAGGFAKRVAKWNGSSWMRVGTGLDAQVHALVSWDDGNGPALYAGGELFSSPHAPMMARWDGSSWSSLGGGMTGGPESVVRALAVFDDGSGQALYAGGDFQTAGGVAANRIARWDGTSWAPLGSGVSHAANYGVTPSVDALAVFDDPIRGPVLLAGGDFIEAVDSGDSYLALWSCPDTIAPVLACPESVTVSDPRSGPPGEIVTFTVTASDDRDSSPSIVCEPPSGSFFSPGITLVQCKATDGANNQSSCSFPVNVLRKQER